MQNKATEYVRRQLNLSEDEPLALQHWLSVSGGADGTVLRDIETNEPVLDLRVGGTYIQFNLTTGQPATEQDYQTFCEIVGV